MIKNFKINFRCPHCEKCIELDLSNNLRLSNNEDNTTLDKETENSVLREQYRDFLIEQRYSIKTRNGNPSTVYDYIKRIDAIAENEKYDWCDIADNINILVKKYDVGGIEEEFGNKSHRAVINALKAYKRFLETI